MARRTNSYDSNCSRLSFVFFFFFQAEDGIRDSSVTGVQTCALPIFAAEHRATTVLKVHARTRILDQDRGRAMLRGETDDLAAQFRIFEATPVDMEEIGRASCRERV